jgi:hypothetical protein
VRITEIFKSQSEAERRKAVTELLIKLEEKKYQAAKASKSPKVG